MPTVDSKGRIVLPKAVREDLGITPGTEVEIREEDGRAIVEPEDDPDDVLERMEELVAEASSERAEPTTLGDRVEPAARKHRDAVRRGADDHADSDAESTDDE